MSKNHQSILRKKPGLLPYFPSRSWPDRSDVWHTVELLAHACIQPVQPPCPGHIQEKENQGPRQEYPIPNADGVQTGVNRASLYVQFLLLET